MQWQSYRHVPRCVLFWEESFKKMQGERVLNLEWSSFILWNSKEAATCGFTGLSAWALPTHTKKKQNPSEFRTADPLACCCVAMWQKWMRKGVLLQQGMMPAVPPGARAFEAPHEKCQNTQWISLNRRDVKSAQVILRKTQLASPSGERGTKPGAQWCWLEWNHLCEGQDGAISLRTSAWLLGIRVCRYM